MGKAADTTPEGRAQRRVQEFTGLMWHIVVYVVVNIFLWIVTPEAAIWVTIPWGLGLAFHVAAYFFDESGFQSRRYQKYLTEEQERDQQQDA